MWVFSQKKLPFFETGTAFQNCSTFVREQIPYFHSLSSAVFFLPFHKKNSEAVEQKRNVVPQKKVPTFPSPKMELTNVELANQGYGTGTTKFQKFQSFSPQNSKKSDIQFARFFSFRLCTRPGTLVPCMLRATNLPKLC